MFHELAVPKVFFDSDALIAGCASRQGAAFVLLQLSELGLLKGLTSQKAVAECRKNLQIKLPDAVPIFEQVLSRALTILDNPSDKETVAYSKMAHKKDLLILSASLKAGAQFLVTFNTRDFYPNAGLGLTVLKPGDLLQRIRLRLTELANFP